MTIVDNFKKTDGCTVGSFVPGELEINLGLFSADRSGFCHYINFESSYD